MYRARDRFDPARPFAPWARRIATNVALDFLKGEPRTLPLEEASFEPRGADPVPQHELSEALRRAFLRLPPRLRAVASLALVEQEPYADIAYALGISMAAVKSREFRALRLLRSSLKRMGFEP
jgi:RNA polymerase sigma-70 factor (ECF subfamily)